MIRLATVASVMAAQPVSAPKARVDTTDSSDTSYWARRLNISTEQLFAAIEKVGPSAAAIRRHLGK